MSLQGGLCRSNLLFYRNCWSKEDCHAAIEQERRLAMTNVPCHTCTCVRCKCCEALFAEAIPRHKETASLRLAVTPMSHLHSLALPARASVRTVQVLRGAFVPKQSPVLREFPVKRGLPYKDTPSRRFPRKTG